MPGGGAQVQAGIQGRRRGPDLADDSAAAAQASTAAQPIPVDADSRRADRGRSGGHRRIHLSQEAAADLFNQLAANRQGVLLDATTAKKYNLKVGQVMEASIPISILAVGYSALVVKLRRSRASTLLENVNVLAIGATSL